MSNMSGMTFPLFAGVRTAAPAVALDLRYRSVGAP